MAGGNGKLCRCGVAMAGPYQTPRNKDVLNLAWPMTIKAIMLHGTVVIDTLLIAPLGETALAAMALATAVAGFVLGVIFAFANALQIRVAQAKGTGDPNFIRSTFWIGVSINICVGLIGLIIILIFGTDVIEFLGQMPAINTMANDYLSIFVLVILGEALGQALSSYFNGNGNTRLPMFSYMLSVPVNIVSSLVFIHGIGFVPAFGIKGAAIGSAIAVCTQTLFLAYRAYQSKVGRPDVWHHGRFATAVSRHMKFALPIVATFVSAAFAMHICTLIYANMALNDFAALAIISPWIMVAGTIGMQWAQASGIIIAQIMGQGARGDDLNRFLKQAWFGAAGCAAAVALIFVIMCMLVDVFYPSLGAETRGLFVGFLPILVLLPFPKGSNAMCGNTLRAAGDTIAVMHFFIWSQWLFRVPATALFILVWDLNAIWVLSIQLIDEVMKFPLFHRRFLYSDWRSGRLL